MPISGTTTNYAGRTKDIHIMQNVSPTGLRPIALSFGTVSNYCAGIQKLVQRYTIALLTEIGSQANYPEFGTNFFANLKTRSQIISKNDLFSLFNLANVKVIREFRAYQAANPGLPVDEQLGTAYLEDVVLGNDSVGLKIRVVPITTDAVEFIVPLPTNNNE